MLFFSAAVYGKYVFETRHPLPLLDILFVVSAALAIHCFIIDRIVLNDKIMNRTFKYALVFSFQALLSVIFLVYALYQQAEAESQMAEAQKQKIWAIKMEQESIMARNEYINDLEECQKHRSDK
jgi:hypothetical protein